MCIAGSIDVFINPNDHIYLGDVIDNGGHLFEVVKIKSEHEISIYYFDEQEEVSVH